MIGNLKERHEEAVASDLLKTLGCEAKFLRHGDDADEPDVLFEKNGKILGIEVATAYYDDLQQAKTEWQIARGKIKPTPKSQFRFGAARISMKNLPEDTTRNYGQNAHGNGNTAAQACFGFASNTAGF